MSDFRRFLLDELYRRVVRLGDAPATRLHVELADVLAFSERINPARPRLVNQEARDAGASG